MKQKIYPDPHGIDVWDLDNYGCVVIHIVNSAEFREITGLDPPLTPIDAKAYTESGLPWFALYDEAKSDVSPPDRLTSVKTVSQKDKEKGVEIPCDDSFQVSDRQTKKLHDD